MLQHLVHFFAYRLKLALPHYAESLLFIVIFLQYAWWLFKILQNFFLTTHIIKNFIISKLNLYTFSLLNNWLFRCLQLKKVYFLHN